MEFQDLRGDKALSSLLNIDSLLSPSSPQTQQSASQKGNTIPLQLDDLLRPSENKTTISSNLSPQQKLTKCLEVLKNDVFQLQEHLKVLNSKRRNLIEHRVEFIARKLARKRGEKLNRSASLDEILSSSGQSLLTHALDGYFGETALYYVLNLFFLKSLEHVGLRPFVTGSNDGSETLKAINSASYGDYSRVLFTTHDYLSQNAPDFSSDNCAWSFARTNLYSWYTPSFSALGKVKSIFSNPQPDQQFNWTSADLCKWFGCLPDLLGLGHLEFTDESEMSKQLLDLVERNLSTPLSKTFHGQTLYKKILIPTLENGSLPLAILEKHLHATGGANSSSRSYLSEINQRATVCEFQPDPSFAIGKSLWMCESECMEVYWTEVNALLLSLEHEKHFRKETQRTRINQAVHIAPHLALELHNLEQLPLTSHRTFHGSAGHIQQGDTFDISFVLDHIDRTRTAKWLKKLAEQLPYWRQFVSSSTTLNWGELHLCVALSKIKDMGLCFYLSHRTLPEGPDGERLRKALLANATLEMFVELPQETFHSYRYLYVFKKCRVKTERDQFKPKFGKYNGFNLQLEESCSSQIEISERGWDHLFVRGAAPLVRHLNQKFPKLFQLATIQAAPEEEDPVHSSIQSFLGKKFSSDIVAIEATRTTKEGSKLEFRKVFELNADHKALIFPHNPSDAPWIENLLNSPPVQFWIKHQILNQSAGRFPRLQELKSAPILDLTHAPSDLVHEYLAWIGNSRPSQKDLSYWACDAAQSVPEKQARYVALSIRCAQLQKIIHRYLPLFDRTVDGSLEIKPEAARQFYPIQMLVPLTQLNTKIQYIGKETTRLLPEHWTVLDANILEQAHSSSSHVIIETSQGSSVQISLPREMAAYVCSQVKHLKGHAWGEIITLLRAPKDPVLFHAQVSEIRRVVINTMEERTFNLQTLDQMALDLFEISGELRAFLIPN
ncbi:MAG: hypothetical protein AB7F43_12850 [Bacteriovoracia bacterium]